MSPHFVHKIGILTDIWPVNTVSLNTIRINYFCTTPPTLG